MTSKIYVSLPESLNSLEKQVFDDYLEASRNTKSREMLQLLQGGMVLKNMGLLQTSIALGLSDELIPMSDEASEAIKQAFLARLAGNTIRQDEDGSNYRSSEPNVPQSDSLPEPEQTKTAQVKSKPSVAKEPAQRATADKPEQSRQVVTSMGVGTMMISQTGGGS